MNQLSQQPLILIIKCPERNKTYNIETEFVTVVEELCQELGDALGCSEQQEIRLYRNDVELDRRQTFQQQGIQKGCQIVAKIVQIEQQKTDPIGIIKQKQQPIQQSLNITVADTENSKNYKFQVNPEDKVSILIQKLSINPNASVHLKFAEQILDQKQTFRQQGIQDNSILQLNIQRLGG